MGKHWQIHWLLKNTWPKRIGCPSRLSQYHSISTKFSAIHSDWLINPHAVWFGAKQIAQQIGVYPCKLNLVSMLTCVPFQVRQATMALLGQNPLARPAPTTRLQSHTERYPTSMDDPKPGGSSKHQKSSGHSPKYWLYGVVVWQPIWYW